MNLRTGIAVCLAFVLLIGAASGEPVKSGPQVGKELPGTFKPVNVTGPDAGKTTCIFCEYGEDPVVMVFARESSAPLTQLIKQLDATTAKNKASNLASCVIFLSSDQGLPKQLKELAGQEKIEKTILRTYSPDGPKSYNLAKDAEVTVLLYTDRVVKANHSFRKAELQEKGIDAIVADVAKILPEKK